MELFKDFLASIKSILNGTADIFTYVIFVTCIGIIIVTAIIKYRKIKKEEKLRMDLHPYFDDEKIRSAKKYYVETQCQDRPPELDFELKESAEVANKANLISFFYKQVFNTTKQRFYLILGDAGMGKTTFMINLFLRYNSGFSPKDYNMAYIPLTYPDADQRIKDIKTTEKSTILLLDGFDEDPKALNNWKSRMDEIILKGQNFRKVIITCRTQFFPDEESIPYQLNIIKLGEGTHTLEKKHVSPFTEKEIKTYLNKRYGRAIVIDDKWLYFNQKRVKANAIVDMAPTLSVRPMLLDKIDDLVLSNRKLEYDHEVFEELVHSWIDRESKKQLLSANDNFKKHMFDFLVKAALEIYKNFRAGHGLFIFTEQIEEIAQDRNIELTILDMKSRSLLNINPDGRIKFSHKTILEYFLAYIDAENIGSEQIIFDSFTYAIKLRRQILKSRLTNQMGLILVSSDSNNFKQLKMGDEQVDSIETIMVGSSPIVNYKYFRLFSSLRQIYVLGEIGRSYSDKKISLGTKTIKEKVYPFHEQYFSVIKIADITYHVDISWLEIKVLNASCSKITLGKVWSDYDPTIK